MTDTWSERADLYRDSEAHREGEDLDLIVEWAAAALAQPPKGVAGFARDPACSSRTALDVATGGGHVARRLREAGYDVTTLDPAPGMKPHVVASAEEIPFADGSFDVVACRVAAHHFVDVQRAVAEMARVSAGLVLVADNLFLSERVEEAEKVRDPTHVRCYDEEEWRRLFGTAGLSLEEVHTFEKRIELEPWLHRAGCDARDADRVRQLLADRIDGERLTLTRIVLKGRKG